MTMYALLKRSAKCRIKGHTIITLRAFRALPAFATHQDLISNLILFIDPNARM
jgi:hypothetical protein